MGSCGLPEEGRRGENYRSSMARGRQFTAAFGNGKTWVYWKRFFKPYPWTQTLKTSPLIQLHARYIKVPTVGKKSGNKAVGISRGGRNTKIHALVDGLGNPLAFMLSSGNDHDSTHAIALLRPCLKNGYGLCYINKMTMAAMRTKAKKEASSLS